ncbi:aromatic amino acid hydroxylase [bacterium]|nr:aromatic amino acid hydroxylase [bacterium]
MSSPATAALPPYLKAFVAEQDYASYTAQDQAAWRYIMRQNRAFFSQHAVPMYTEGLRKTGISIEQIPRIEEMDQCLAALGWGAVPVEGFLPPAAFLDFQARAVLPIACDMRTVDHIAYTPAPDIVHEAAGHAPILAHAPYGEYLHKYAAMAQKAINSADDIRLYEAIRLLSDIKENPDATAAQIAQAEAQLRHVTQSITRVSEASKVARMNWWTVEYGLIGDLKAPKIYGAGLLSSVGESQTCLSDKVKKIPLSADCVNTSYDITEPQPQLFVAKDMDQMVEVLEEFEKTLSFRRGGKDGLEEARICQTVTTAQWDSGLETSGVVAEFDDAFIRYSGPVQLSFENTELPGHGKTYHAQGFSSPLGRWKGAAHKAAHTLSDADLAKLGLVSGKKARLEFASAFIVEGLLTGWTRQQGRLVLLQWKDCTVSRGSKVFYQPSWGPFDMAVAEHAHSVWGGPSDRPAYGEWMESNITSHPGRSSPFSDGEKQIFALYQELRALREKHTPADSPAWQKLAEKVARQEQEWLLLLELYEAGAQTGKSPAWLAEVEQGLNRLQKDSDPQRKTLIQKGISLSKAV